MCFPKTSSSALFVLASCAFLTSGVVSAVPLNPSPIDTRIAHAEARVKAAPDSAVAYNDLALAYCRKGRDTQDPAVYEQALTAVNRSFQLSQRSNYESRKLQVTVLLGKHEFAQALKLATDLNHQVPDDLNVWASLVDANIALGNYAAAEPQAQWVLDLRPGNTLGFEKSAELRELFGDVPGAVEFVDEAIRRTSPNDLDQRSFLLTQKARLQLVSGYEKEAEGMIQQALQLFPESLLATEVLARVRCAQGKFADAAVLFEKRYRAVKSATNLYDWAEALEMTGQEAQAAVAFQQFETLAHAESTKPLNADLSLVSFYLSRKHDVAAALSLSEKMSAQRQDYETLGVYAWALYSNGRYAEAKTQMDRALAVGLRDPRLFCRAAQIALKAGDAAAAGKYERELATFKGFTCPREQVQTSDRIPSREASR